MSDLVLEPDYSTAITEVMDAEAKGYLQMELSVTDKDTMRTDMTFEIKLTMAGAEACKAGDPTLRGLVIGMGLVGPDGQDVRHLVGL
jgi:hypothetical protein